MEQTTAPNGHSAEWLAGYEAGYREALANGKRAKVGDAHELPDRISDADKARFLSFTNKQDGGCWLWTGSKSAPGNFPKAGPRARFRLNGRLVAASRVSLLIFRGERIPPDKVACHSCDNPLCVNPDHLWVGTHKENMRDMMRKGRVWFANRTHCKAGHELTGPNTMLNKNTAGYIGRVCRACFNARRAILRRERKLRAA